MTGQHSKQWTPEGNYLWQKSCETVSFLVLLVIAVTDLGRGLGWWPRLHSDPESWSHSWNNHIWIRNSVVILKKNQIWIRNHKVITEIITFGSVIVRVIPQIVTYGFVSKHPSVLRLSATMVSMRFSDSGPFRIRIGFATWLRIRLQFADPGPDPACVKSELFFK